MTFRRRLKPNANVDLIPMIDVVFQLVVFFMVSSTFILTPGIALDLPEASSAEPVVMDRMVVTVVGEDEFYLNRERFDLAGLHAELALVAEQQAEQPGVMSVVIEGDRNVPYNLMVQVLDALRRNGFRAVNLRTLEAGS
ncbi:MAG: biopolymer transporter ExbD [Spirochaetaceae bacterium]|nr:MAG: biopolymer transporter ExbD [Spirochaetaceae bacterium]